MYYGITSKNTQVKAYMVLLYNCQNDVLTLVNVDKHLYRDK